MTHEDRHSNPAIPTSMNNVKFTQQHEISTELAQQPHEISNEFKQKSTLLLPKISVIDLQ